MSILGYSRRGQRMQRQETAAVIPLALLCFASVTMDGSCLKDWLRFRRKKWKRPWDLASPSFRHLPFSLECTSKVVAYRWKILWIHPCRLFQDGEDNLLWYAVFRLNPLKKIANHCKMHATSALRKRMRKKRDRYSQILMSPESFEGNFQKKVRRSFLWLTQQW